MPGSRSPAGRWTTPPWDRPRQYAPVRSGLARRSARPAKLLRPPWSAWRRSCDGYSHNRYSDCGYTHHTIFSTQTKAGVAAWLGARFAERDRFVQAHIVVVGPTEESSTGPLGIGSQALRISDS